MSLKFILLRAFAVTGVLVVARAARAETGAPSAPAQNPFDGQWTMTPVAESFTVQQWSNACGPAPVSGTLVPGGAAMITSSGGELAIQGPRTLRTDACLDPLPTLARSVHTADSHSWRTRCQTPPSDPRRAVINTAYFASSASADATSITIAETGRYEFTVNGAACIADVKRSGSLARVVAATATPSATATSTATTTTAATPSPPAPNPYATAPKVDCSSPGDPAVLQVRPSRKLLKVGDTFGFRGIVLDASGCPTGTPITWTVGAVTFSDGQAHAGQPAIDASGKLTVPVTDFTDATFDVVATVAGLAGQAAGKSARASVEVAVPADYSALLAQSGLDPNGERDEPAIAVIATSSIGAAATRTQDAARKKRFVFIGVIASLAALLGVVAIFGARRARKAKLVEAAASERHAEKMRNFERQKAEREAQHAAQMKKHLEGIAIAQQQTAAALARGLDTGPMFCPSCRKEYPARSAFCPLDSNRLISIRGHEALLGGPSGGVCPVCHRGFNPGVKVCPDHREELVPAPVASVAAPPSQQAAAVAPRRGKICPKCGTRFDGNATFCGQDGSALVLVN